MNKINSCKQLEIANICYANVSGQFAMFQNSKYRGPNFTWELFVDNCEKSSEDWVYTHNIRGDKENIRLLAKQYSKEIAQNLVNRMTE